MTTTDYFYLGDAVYVHRLGSCIVLTTENGLSVSNYIVLEPEVVAELLAYLERLRKTDDHQ